MYINKDKIGGEDFQELKFDSETERWFKKALRLAI